MTKDNYIQGEFSFNDPLVDPNPGPSVDIIERAEHISYMLSELGAISRADGFKHIASQDDDRHVELAERYGDVTQVVQSIEQNQEVSARFSKVSFAKAFGLEALISSGLVTENEAKEMASESYHKEILLLFQNAEGADNRKKTKSWLNYQTRVLSGKRTRRPKSERPTSVDIAKVTETVQLELEPEIIRIDDTRKSEPINKSDKLKLEKIEEIESLPEGRISAGAGAHNRAQIKTISGNYTEFFVEQGSNGRLKLKVPRELAYAVATALDNGATERDIKDILNNKRPSMTANIGKRSGIPRKAVRY